MGCTLKGIFAHSTPVPWPGEPKPQPIMNTLLRTFAGLAMVFLLGSCVFDEPFDPQANIPVDAKLLGRWEQADAKSAKRMLVLQHSANEYLVHYPQDEDGMYFRAYAVELEGRNFIQIQLIGTADEPATAKERRYHLFEAKREGDSLGLRALNADLLGKDFKTTAELRKAFAAHKDDPNLFDETTTFKRLPAAP